MTILRNLHEYLYAGIFRVYAPGAEAFLRLGEPAPTLDTFLDMKGATSFCFVSFNPIPEPHFRLTPESEAQYLAGLQERHFDLIMEVSKQGWAYQLAGFEPNSGGAAGILCLLLLDVPTSDLRTFMLAAELEWCIVGRKGTIAILEMNGTSGATDEFIT